MATSYTWTTIQSEILALADEPTGSELDNNIANVIARAEDRLLKDLDLEIFTKVSTPVAFVSGTATITKPTDMVIEKDVWYTNGTSQRIHLQKRSYSWLIDYWPNSSTTGTQKYIADVDETTWAVAPTPGNTFNWQARYVYRPAGLAVGNPTTFLSTKCGDALFYACMIEAEQFIKADERVNGWKQFYAERLLPLRVELSRLENADYTPLTATPRAQKEK